MPEPNKIEKNLVDQTKAAYDVDDDEDIPNDELVRALYEQQQIMEREHRRWMNNILTMGIEMLRAAIEKVRE